MPVTASLTLWGMYQYDPTILSGLQLPDGMDADTVTDNLLMETSALEILYPDPNFLKKAITVWSEERLDVWQKLYNTTVLEYDPIENYDRKEESLETAAGSVVDQRTHNRTAEQVTQVSGSQIGNRDTRTNTTGSDATTRSGSNESIASNTAYDTNAFADASKNVSSGNDQTQASRLETGSGTEKTGSSSTEASAGQASEKLQEDGSRSSSDQRRVTSRIHGNIGVTSSQQLIMAEREVAEFCMVDYIVNDFIGKFCVMVY